MAILAGLTSLGVVTPGVVLAGIQAWTPVVLAAATLAGTAIGVAGAAYRKSHSNAKRLAILERKLPKRSTDVALMPPPSGVPATPGGTTPGESVTPLTATSPQEGDTR